jgi:hypothetical protein
MTKKNKTPEPCEAGDICNDCRREMEESEDNDICDDCQKQIEEEYGPDFFAMMLSDCIFMSRADEAQIPLAVVTCDGATYVGGLVDFQSNGAVCLINPLRYIEMVDSRLKTITGGLTRPYAQLGLPPIVFLNAAVFVVLKASNPKDASFAGAYNDSYKRYAAEDVGIELPPSGTVVGRA